MALDRLFGQWPAESATSTKLVKAAENWFTSNKNTLASFFSSADTDETAYALGAVISSHAWHNILLAHWDEMVLPWLKASILAPASRHLLHRGLKKLRSQEAQETLALALVWLSHHGRLFHASFVLNPLLSREDLGEKAQEIIAMALAWLGEYPKALEAGFVLPPLLSRGDLGVKAQDVITTAMGWFAAHPTAWEASFVLAPLLSRDDLGETAQEAISMALAWLEEYPMAGLSK